MRPEKDVLFTAWDEAEELVTSLNELNDNEIIECREDLKQRAKLIRDVLSPYGSREWKESSPWIDEKGVYRESPISQTK